MITREEAIALLNEQYETCKRIYDCSADQRKSYPNVPQFMEALGMALSALRPVSREQVEKVWRGEWLNFYNDFSTAECSKCGELFEVSPDETPKEEFFKAFSGFYHFCPACGAAQNDKAVEMVMERWKEAVVDEA